MNRKKFCFVTAARSEYGLLKWLMFDISKLEEFELQIVATGGHLLEEQGHTIDQIVEEGFSINCVVDAALDVTSPVTIAESMGRMAEGFAKVFDQLQPDYVVVLGDRYELLPICNTAFVMSIPIIHISGGDVTEGALDNGIRNAITMLADYHFPGTEDSARNIIRMRNSNQNVWAVGEPGLDAFYREDLMSREELAENLGLDINKKWGLMTYHAETEQSIEYNLKNAESCIDALMQQENFSVVITYANADLGGLRINAYLEEQVNKFPDRIKVVPSLGHRRYLSFMKQVEFVIGNSSSGIVEAPFMNIPVVNIGDRQKGRYQCSNIIQCEATRQAICDAVGQAMNMEKKQRDDIFYWGDGHTSERIVSIIRKFEES